MWIFMTCDALVASYNRWIISKSPTFWDKLRDFNPKLNASTIREPVKHFESRTPKTLLY